MGKLYIFTKNLQGNALSSGIYTAGKKITRPPVVMVVTVATNFKSVLVSYLVNRVLDDILGLSGSEMMQLI